MIMVQSVLITGSVVVWVLSGHGNMRMITDGSSPRHSLEERVRGMRAVIEQFSFAEAGRFMHCNRVEMAC
jgi:hypothetical protein